MNNMEGIKTSSGQIVMLPEKILHPHPDNPRKDLGDLEELTKSIMSKGVLQNLTVVPRVTVDPDSLEEILDGWTVVIGHRRLAAARKAGLQDLPCVVADMSEREQFETMMVENVQRSDLTVWEQAQGFQIMLDMGGSVEDVAQKTGFSASTIRRRVKLTELDEEKFKKGQKRGATLEDYMKLEKIRDPGKRNKVLESIGTAEFNNALKKTVEEEKFLEYWQKAQAALQSADWLRPRTKDDSTGWNGDYESFMQLSKTHQVFPERPADAETTEYFYEICGDYAWIYRKKDKKKTKSPKEKAKDAADWKMNKIEKELNATSKRHREIRQEFVKGFSQFNTYELDIAEFAVRAFAEAGNRLFPLNTFGKLADVQRYTPKGSHYESLEPEAWKKARRSDPRRMLLLAAFCALDTGNEFVGGSWEDGIYIKVHSKNNNLTTLYECLASLDYELCEEEIQMRDGTHPLFAEALQVAQEYKKAVKK